MTETFDEIIDAERQRIRKEEIAKLRDRMHRIDKLKGKVSPEDFIEAIKNIDNIGPKLSQEHNLLEELGCAKYEAECGGGFVIYEYYVTVTEKGKQLYERLFGRKNE
jgi:hypothetical protein